MDDKELLTRIHNKALCDITQSLHYEPREQVYILIAAEVEFYIPAGTILSVDDLYVQQLYANIEEIASKSNITVENLESEEGKNQFEIQTTPTDSPEDLAAFLYNLQIFAMQTKQINLLAKPNQATAGSSVHFHISLYNNDDINLFAARDTKYSNVLYQAVAGILHFMPNSMQIFAPTDNCYLRMQPPAKGQIHKHYSINYSWGFNNRTCAIRIPQSTFIAPSNTRIEHRVCSPVANMNLAIASILYSLSFGITNNLTAAQPIYGDAFDPQYMHLKRFPIFLQEALLQKSIKDIMQNSL